MKGNQVYLPYHFALRDIVRTEQLFSVPYAQTARNLVKLISGGAFDLSNIPNSTCNLSINVSADGVTAWEPLRTHLLFVALVSI